MLNITINLVQVDLATIIIWHMKYLALSRAVHPIRRFDPPEGSDQIRPENRPTRSSHQSTAGHLFQKPTSVGRSRFSSPKPEKTRSDQCTKNFQQKFPESSRNFQNPARFSRFRP